MKQKVFFLYLLISKATFMSIAQVVDTSFILPVLTTNSAVTNMEIADSFSQISDSINASRYFLNIDPFFFVSSNVTPGTIDSSFADYFLTQRTKEKYRKIFTTAYNKERTDAYKTFKSMLDEDQTLRRKLGYCRDSFSSTTLEKRIMQTDSPHFEYLYNYVRKNGWPTYENGGMYAQIIALHDAEHMQYYLLHIKKAVIAGNTPLNFYYHILNRAKPSTLEQLLKYKNKVAFDISYVLSGKPASITQINEIEKVVYKWGPIKYQYYVYEATDEKYYRSFMGMKKDENYWLAWYILVEIDKMQRNYHGRLSKGVPYDFVFLETVKKQQKLTLYLVY